VNQKPFPISALAIGDKETWSIIIIIIIIIKY
jgi:hypothetical protein